MHKAKLKALLCLWGILSAMPAFGDKVHYKVTELRFADSPAAGAIMPPFTSWEPKEPNPHICKVSGLSDNNLVTGMIVASSGLDHWFVFEDGQVRDLTAKPQERCMSATISPKGVALAVTMPAKAGNAEPKNILSVYEKQKVQSIGNVESKLVIVEQLNSKGYYLLEGPPNAGVAFLCKLGGTDRVKAPTVGVTLNQNGVAGGVELIDGVLPLVPVGITGGKPVIFTKYACAGASCIPGCVNFSGQFVCSTALGRSDEKKTGIKSYYQGYIFDPKTKAVTEIPFPATMLPHENSCSALQISDEGDVLGNVGPTGSDGGVPFYCHGNKSVLFSEMVPSCDVVRLQNLLGLIAGSTKDHHLFLYDHGKTSEMGSLGGDTIQPMVISTSGKVIGSAKAPDGQLHAFIADTTGCIDLNTALPPEADYVLESAEFINDSGTIVARGHAKARGSVIRWFVLMPGN